jgi:AcrR family transcriptional regulator
MDSAEEGRSRKSGAQRIDQILDAAEQLVLEAGALPIPMKRVGELTGASRALVYAYFPDPDHLARALLQRQVSRLAAAGLEAAGDEEDFLVGVQRVCAIYLDHVARHGPVLSIVQRDLPAAASERDVLRRVLERLARAARRELRFTPHEAVVFLELVSALPEEAGRLVFEGELALEEAHALCARLVGSALEALRVNEGAV